MRLALHAPSVPLHWFSRSAGTVLASMSTKVTRPVDPAGLAALSICEALALALAEEGAIPKKNICGAIEDAIAAHRDAVTWSSDPAVHREAASLAERVRKSVENVGSEDAT